MTSAMRSEATAAPVAAAPERKAPGAARAARSPTRCCGCSGPRGTPRVARAMAPAAQSLQRCGANCGCSTCGSGKDDELLDDEKLGAGLLRSAVARRSA